MKRLLIVDDEPEVAHMLCHALQWDEFGCAVPFIAYGASQALHLLETEHIDVLVTDIRMPGMDGLALLRQVQERWPHMKRLVVSAFDDYEYIRGALRLGVMDYLLKPVDIHEFEDIMAKLVQEDERQQLTQENNPMMLDDQFQEHFIYRWVMGSIAPYELSERLSMAQIDPSGKSSAVCVLRLLSPGEDSRALARQYIIDALQRTLSEGIEAYVCKEQDDLYVIVSLFTFKAGHDGNPLEKTMRNLVARLKLANRIDAFIGIGSTVADPQQVRSSYILARRLVEHSILQPSGTIMDGKDASLSDTTCRYLSRVDFDALHVMLRNGDCSGAVRFIIRILRNNNPEEDSQPLDLNLMVSEILVQTGMMVNRFGTGQPFAVDAWYQRYHQLTTPDEFTAWVQLMVRNAVQSMHESREHPVVRQMLEIMQESLADSSLCLKTITKCIPMSATYLGQLFRQETGMLFTTFLSDMRISGAKRLLASTSKRINEIACELGFNNQSYFNKVFKKHTGQTPAEFRRNSGNLIVPVSDSELSE